VWRSADATARRARSFIWRWGLTLRVSGLDKRFRPAICGIVRLTEIGLSERSAAMRGSGKGIGVAVAEFKTERRSAKARKETVCKAKHTGRVKIYITKIEAPRIKYGGEGSDSRVK